MLSSLEIKYCVNLLRISFVTKLPRTATEIGNCVHSATESRVDSFSFSLDKLKTFSLCIKFYKTQHVFTIFTVKSVDTFISQ